MEQEQTHFEIMEQLGQLNLFDVSVNPINVNIAAGDIVRCNITEESNPESYNYFKYYQPNVLKDRGEVIAIQGHTLHVRFKNDVVLLNLDEITT